MFYFHDCVHSLRLMSLIVASDKIERTSLHKLESYSLFLVARELED